jgi:hypothetical protein
MAHIAFWTFVKSIIRYIWSHPIETVETVNIAANITTMQQRCNNNNKIILNVDTLSTKQHEPCPVAEKLKTSPVAESFKTTSHTRHYLESWNPYATSQW